MVSAFLLSGAIFIAGGAVSDTDPFVIVLGVAQDGGAPQAGCRRECCAGRWDDPTLRLRVACLGIVDPQTSQRWMIDATPDFPAQLRALGAAAPPVEGGLSAGILLTHAHIGHYTGLIHLGREVMGARGVTVYAMPRMEVFLSEKGPWEQLIVLGSITIEPMSAGVAIPLNDRITVTPMAVPHRHEYSETVGFRIDGPNRSALYVPDIDKWHRLDVLIEDLVMDVDVAYLDGTFFDDGELPDRNMAEIPHPLIVETMERLGGLSARDRRKVRFIHLNHTNPALRSDSSATRDIETSGFGVAAEGERFSLGGVPPATPITTQPVTTRPATTQPVTGAVYPAAPRFDLEGSDPRAILIADSVMTRMGGWDAWDRTRYIRWNFLGARDHVWDKHRNRARIEGTSPRTGKHYVMLLDVDTGVGRAFNDGEEVTAPDELPGMLDAGVAAWINDSYWLVMPYKLKDTGVTLKYVGAGKLPDERPADILQLTFTGVGRTPQNKYHLWVARSSGLVEQWAFFSKAGDDEPQFTTPWGGWKQYGRIMLSGDRGELRGHRAQLTNIAVYDELPDSVFESPDPVDWEAIDGIKE